MAECLQEKSSWCWNKQVCQGRSVKPPGQSYGLDTSLYNNILFFSFFISKNNQVCFCFVSGTQCSKEGLREYAACLNNARTEILQDMKTNAKHIPIELESCTTDAAEDSNSTLYKFVASSYLQSVEKFKITVE